MYFSQPSVITYFFLSFIQYFRISSYLLLTSFFLFSFQLIQQMTHKKDHYTWRCVPNISQDVDVTSEWEKKWRRKNDEVGAKKKKKKMLVEDDNWVSVIIPLVTHMQFWFTLLYYIHPYQKWNVWVGWEGGAWQTWKYFYSSQWNMLFLRASDMMIAIDVKKIDNSSAE